MSEKSMKESVQSFAVKRVLHYLDEDPVKSIPKLLDWAEKFDKDGLYKNQIREIRRVMADPQNNWYQMVLSVWRDIDPGVRRTVFENFLVNASLIGSARQEKAKKEHGCNIPWAILMDPTSACNLHCTGCWAAEYGNRLNLSYETLSDIVRQGKELGVFFYLLSGGEPLVRKADIIRLCEEHSDCMFAAFTNGTLIDEAFAKEMLRVKNFVPAISVEGFEEATDARRGKGTYQAVMRAMDILREHKLAFGASCCYTSQNVQSLSSEEYIDHLIEKGAKFAWFFHYMPVGKDAVPELLPTPEQRALMVERIRAYRSTKSIFTIDFQNDGEFVGGCIAGGRRYFHINANGDIEACAFVHYADSNLKEKTLLEALKSPFFMAYKEGQPFNKNLLRPCPMLENPECLRAMVHRTEAYSCDMQAPEDVDVLCGRCAPFARNWQGPADALWEKSHPEGKK